MMEAGALTASDRVYLGGSLYWVGERTPDGDVVLVHECPDGTVDQRVFGTWEEVETAGERLAWLRGELDLAAERAGRRYGNPMRREIARGEHAKLLAQIRAMEDEGVEAAEVVLGTERCHTCRGSGLVRGDDICDDCWGGGR